MLDYPVPPPGPPGPFGTMAWLRATVSRFAEGETHARRRAMVEARLAALDPAALRAAARAAAEHGGGGAGRVPREYVPVAVLAAATGVDGDVVDDVRTVAAAYQPGTDAPGADEALRRLLDRLPPGDEEALAQHVALLVQACEATAALIRGDDLPVRSTKRLDPDGNVVVIDLAGPAVRRGTASVPGPSARAGARGRESAMFADLHKPGDPLLLPNAWDHASAAALAAAGFKAIGTTSLGVAAAIGVPDGASATKEADATTSPQRLVHLPVPISVDAEHGFSEDPHEVAEYAQRLEALGVAGINLEDRNGDPKHHAARDRRRQGSATSLFVNARTDTYWLGDGTGTRERCQAYIDAGADGIFVPGVRDERRDRGAGQPRRSPQCAVPSRHDGRAPRNPRRRAHQHRLSAVPQSDRRRRRSGDSDPRQPAAGTRAEL